MTNLTQSVYQLLLDLLGTAVDNRVYFVTMPPDAVFPLVVYGSVFGGTGDRASGNHSLYRSRYQIDLYANNPDQLMSLRQTAIVGLENYSDGFILSTRIDTDVPYYVDELDKWRNIIDISLDSEWES